MARKRDDGPPDPPVLDPPGERRTRNETVDHAAIYKAAAGAFAEGGATARQVVDALTLVLKEERGAIERERVAKAAEIANLHVEIARLHGSHAVGFVEQQKLIERLHTVAGQNVSLALAEGQAKERQEEVRQKGENTRHAMSMVAENPFLGIVLQKLLPGVDLKPPRPAGEGNTPREAAERFAASLRSGSEGSRLLLDVLGTYCAEELERPSDLGLLLEFFQGAMGDAPPAPEQKTEAAS